MAREMLNRAASIRFDTKQQTKIHVMKITTQLTAALFAAVIFTSSAMAGAQWPSRPEYAAPRQNVPHLLRLRRQANDRGKRLDHRTIATSVRRASASRRRLPLPHLGNIGNGAL